MWYQCYEYEAHGPILILVLGITTGLRAHCLTRPLLWPPVFLPSFPHQITTALPCVAQRDICHCTLGLIPINANDGQPSIIDTRQKRDVSNVFFCFCTSTVPKEIPLAPIHQPCLVVAMAARSSGRRKKISVVNVISGFQDRRLSTWANFNISSLWLITAKLSGTESFRSAENKVLLTG